MPALRNLQIWIVGDAYMMLALRVDGHDVSCPYEMMNGMARSLSRPLGRIETCPHPRSLSQWEREGKPFSLWEKVAERSEAG